MLNHPSISPLAKPSPLNPTPDIKVFAHTLVKLAENNPKIIGIAAVAGTGLDKLQAKLPNNISMLALLSNTRLL